MDVTLISEVQEPIQGQRLFFTQDSSGEKIVFGTSLNRSNCPRDAYTLWTLKDILHPVGILCLFIGLCHYLRINGALLLSFQKCFCEIAVLFDGDVGEQGRAGDEHVNCVFPSGCSCPVLSEPGLAVRAPSSDCLNRWQPLPG